MFLGTNVRQFQRLAVQGITWPDTALTAEILALCLLVDHDYAFWQYIKYLLVVIGQTERRSTQGIYLHQFSQDTPWKTIFADAVFAGSAAR